MALLKLSSIEVDTKAETDGEWVQIKEWTGLDPEKPFHVTKFEDEGIELKMLVRSTNCHSFKVARQKAGERLEEMKKDNPDGIPDELVDVENGKLMAEHLLLGWSGFDVEYSPDAAVALLTKPSARIHRQMVMFCATRCGQRKAEFLASEADNLGKSPRGR